MEEKKEYLEKIENLVYSAAKFNEMSFRMVLEGLVAKAGEEGEYLMVRYLNARDLDLTTRINVIRVVGYIQSPHCLVPLKKIIDTEENIHLKKEAVISVSKYNDRRALNILNYALANIKNPLLLETINTEISKIKKNNPLFGLLPRFLEGADNLKNFNVTLDILKRILTPTDAGMFTNYLRCGKKIIEKGAFEILCFTADLEQRDAIMNFYQDRFVQIDCIDQPKCEEFFVLTEILKNYFIRFPELIDQELDNLGTQLYLIKAKRVRASVVSIICKSKKDPAISFVKQVYQKDPAIRSTIISEYSGNEAAVDFLLEQFDRGLEPEPINTATVPSSSDTEPEFELLNDEGETPYAGNDIKKMLIRSLLNIRQGIDYFFLRFDSLVDEEREIIVDQLPYGSNHDLSRFMIMLLESPYFPLKEALMDKVCQYYEYSVKDVLFDPMREEEFFSMERRYVQTVTALFPIKAIKMLMEKILDDDLSINKSRKYITQISEMVTAGLTFVLKDKGFLNSLLGKIVFFNNSEFNCLFISIFRHIKTFDLETYKNFNEPLGLFTTIKGKKVTNPEADELRKARKNLNEIFFEIRRISEGLKTMERLFTKPVLDFDLLNDFLSKNGICISLHIADLCQYIGKYLQQSGPETIKDWVQLMRRYPFIGFRLRHEITKKRDGSQGPVKFALTKLLETLPQDSPKIILQLSSQQMTAILREQCQELIPNIPITTENLKLESEDVLLCDQETLKDFILSNTLPSRKLYLMLDKRSDFSSYKSYNPKPLVKPFSAYRIMKEILRDLYTA